MTFPARNPAREASERRDDTRYMIHKHIGVRPTCDRWLRLILDALERLVGFETTGELAGDAREDVLGLHRSTEFDVGGSSGCFDEVTRRRDSRYVVSVLGRNVVCGSIGKVRFFCSSGPHEEDGEDAGEDIALTAASFRSASKRK